MTQSRSEGGPVDGRRRHGQTVGLPVETRIEHSVNPDYAPTEERRDLTFHPVDPQRARTLTVADVERFNRDGFVSPLPVFSGQEMDQLRAYIDDLIHTVVSAPDRRNSYSINTYHVVCAGLYDLIHTPLILDYVQDIVGPDIVCWGTHLFAKQPHDVMQVPLHQDAIYWPLTPPSR